MKKLLSLIAIMIMVALSISSMVFSVSAEGAWDGITAATGFASGTGTAEDPYIIANGEQLKYFADLINTKETHETYTYLNYKVGADIDLGGNMWYRIADTASPFRGVFDGDGHTISNFLIFEHPAALFGAVADGTIKNLKIDYADIFATGSVASAFVGNVKNGFSLTIDNCEVGARVRITGACGDGCTRIGGIWGGMDSNSIVYASNCINRARIILDNTSKADSGAGGIGGVFRSGSIKNCVNLGSVVVNYVGAKTSHAGGVVGLIVCPGDSVIENVINCANVSGYTNAGGVIGYLHTSDATLEIKNAFSITNNITAYEAYGTAIGAAKDGQTATLANIVTIAIEGLDAVGGFVPITGEGVLSVGSVDEIAFNVDYSAILTSLGLGALTMPVPPGEETDPDVPVAKPAGPEDTEPEETKPEETKPEETKPEETKPEDTKPEGTEPTQTPSTDAPGTEKPAEGGCGSVVAGGLAILAVVALAGVALKKRD